jgi:hypothetical protein
VLRDALERGLFGGHPFTLTVASATLPA